MFSMFLEVRKNAIDYIRKLWICRGGGHIEKIRGILYQFIDIDTIYACTIDHHSWGRIVFLDDYSGIPPRTSLPVVVVSATVGVPIIKAVVAVTTVAGAPVATVLGVGFIWTATGISVSTVTGI